MEFLDAYMIPVIVGICLIVGFLVKKWVKDDDHKYIPTIVAGLGVIIAIWVNGLPVTPEVVLQGLVSGLASTGLHQLFKQYIDAQGKTAID